MVTIGNKKIGDGEPCFITFEAGATHDGFDYAKQLITLAAEAGADAVKFQILDPDRLIADKERLFSYDILVDRKTGATETVSEPLYDILCRRSLSDHDWRKLKKYSDELGLAFFATVGFEEEVNLLHELGCHSIKIASADINHWPLIRQAARTGTCIQLDTGNATIGEVEEAIDIVRTEGNENIIIHNCPSGYPARLESINLNIIPTLKRMFSYPIAFSDHTPGWEMDIAAVALGANLIEKTITLDRMTPSVEHMFSLEQSDMKRFIQSIREVEVALGKPRRILHQKEIEHCEANRRSSFIKQPVKKGQPISGAKIEFRRPGFGISPKDFESMQGLHFSKDLPAGHMINFSDLE